MSSAPAGPAAHELSPANGSYPRNGTNTTHDSPPVSPGSNPMDTIVFLVFGLSLAVVIIVGNILIVLAYRLNSRLRTKANTFLVSLAISDSLVGIVSLPLWMIVQLLGLKTGSVFLLMFINFDIFSALTSVLHLTAISIERFIAISKPFLYPAIPGRYYKCTICFAWLLAAVISVLYWISSMYDIKKYYVAGVLLIGFIGPLLVIGSMYCGIFKIAKSLILREPCIKETNAPLRRNRGKSSKKHIKQERKVAVTVSIITGLFFAAWLPYYVILLIGTFCYPDCWPSSGNDVTRIIAFSKWMHYGNSAVNAFVYSFRDQEMRRTFARILYNRFTKVCIDVKQINGDGSAYL